MKTPSEASASGVLSPESAVQGRRGFLARAAAVLLGAAACLVPAAAGVVALLNPLRQKREAGRLVRLASLATVPEDGTPRKFPVIMDRTDAWSRFPNEPVGAVFVRRVAEGGVEAVQVVCPHAGCFVDYDAAQKIFACPCHNATFDLAGKRLQETSPSPRDLDSLEVDPQKLQRGEVWVKFESFRTGIPQKVSEA